MMALLLQHNVDFVVRLHQLRPGSNACDAMQTWERPQKPKWMGLDVLRCKTYRNSELVTVPDVSNHVQKNEGRKVSNS